MYVTCYIHVFAWVKLGRKSSGASLTIWEFNENVLTCVTTTFCPGRGLSNCYQCFETLTKAIGVNVLYFFQRTLIEEKLICRNYKHVNSQANWELTTLCWQWVRNILIDCEETSEFFSHIWTSTSTVKSVNVGERNKETLICKTISLDASYLRNKYLAL